VIGLYASQKKIFAGDSTEGKPQNKRFAAFLGD
jgi:hypothetical protein